MNGCTKGDGSCPPRRRCLGADGKKCRSKDGKVLPRKAYEGKVVCRGLNTGGGHERCSTSCDANQAKPRLCAFRWDEKDPYSDYVDEKVEKIMVKTCNCVYV